MDELKKQIVTLVADIDAAMQQLHIAEQRNELEGLRLGSQEPDFWNDTTKAQAAMKRLAELDDRTQPWIQLSQAAHEVAELLELGDDSMHSELATQISKLQTTFD